MAEPISIQQLKDASLDVKSLEEVVNGDENVVVTTRLGETYPSVKSVLENMVSNLGFIIVDSFEVGATLTQRNQVLRHAEDGKLYRWGGSLPKTVVANSTPASSGGFGSNAWLEVSDLAFRLDLQSTNGANFVGFDSNVAYAENTVGGKIKNIESEQSKIDLSYPSPLSKSKKVKIASGGYSWWCEPQSISIDGVYPRTVVGAVDTNTGWLKSISIDTSVVGTQTKEAYLVGKDRFVPDEHDASVTVQAGDDLVTFCPPHDDVDYLPYRVASKNTPFSYSDEKRITSIGGKVSYTQAFYLKNGTLYVFYRSGGVNGAGRSWHMARSTDWGAEQPTWDIKELFTDSDQLYMRVVPHPNGYIFRFLLTKNARYENNGLWYAYWNINKSTVQTGGGGDVGSINAPINISDLTKIYSSARKIRLYDAMSQASFIPILISEFDNHVDSTYKYILYQPSENRILRDVSIVNSGYAVGRSYYYFGGAHFSNNLPNIDGSNFALSNVFLARAEGAGLSNIGINYIEEWKPTDATGTAWEKVRVIETSTTERLWRPRVPFNASQFNKPCQVELTWCSGEWRSYTDYDSHIWALLK